ncbi:MAG TPA: hypothetical protein PLU67_05145 [Candidatus Kapabacteria bacterium]|jgi:hypothetical protein|nr:hypothetical protein [Candidatus Kapabacteria bacterium]HOQ48973.1 hypothetical protein [Candidatus Kapabacteria bacterium]HPU23271.1 hypothetical protein [Candidatus Kapabacteria bacterium]
MKLDVLISKYLDGELSYDEDIYLRNLLKNNPDAKAEFDSAVIVNSAIREDAQSIHTPQDLLKNTEDLVLMRILSANEPASAQKEKRKIPLWLPRLSFVFAVIMIATLYFVTNNSNIDSVNNSPSFAVNNSGIEQKQIIPKPDLSYFSPIAENTNTIKPINNSQKVLAASGDNSSQNSQMILEDYVTLTESVDNNSLSDATISNLLVQTIDYSSIDEEIENNYSKTINNNESSGFSLFSMSRTQALSSTFVPANNQIKINQNTTINLSFLDNFTTPVVLSTLYTTNSINKNSKTISSLSQSIAYNCSEDVALGIEFGYTEYNYDRTTMIKVPFNSGSLNSKVEIGNSPDQSGEYVYIPINLAQNYQQYWISTFIDYDVFDYDRISLNTRIGAGLSGNGAMFYSRLISDIELINGVYLKFGGEIKSFEGLTLNAKTKYITTGSLIYGIKLKLY